MRVTIDVEAERAATPGCAHVAHLNNAGAALPTAATLDAVISHLRLEAERGGYEAATSVAERLDDVLGSVAALLGAARDEVALTGSDTQSWAKALWGLVLGAGITAGGRILVDRLAYNSHYLALLQASEHTGAAIEVVPSTPDGTLDLTALESLLARGDAQLVAATHIGTHRGLVNPVAEIGARCAGAGVPYFLDACQSAGQLPLDVGRIACDVLTATGRKWLRGPRGTGFLFVRSEFAERLRPPGISEASARWIDADHYELRAGAARFNEFEATISAQLGLGVAVDHALALGLDAIAARVGALAERLRSGLGSLEHISLHDGGLERSGIVTFAVEGLSPAEVTAAATAAGVNVSVSTAAWARLDMIDPNPAAVVRASPHYYNTDQELDRLLEVVEACRPG